MLADPVLARPSVSEESVVSFAGSGMLPVSLGHPLWRFTLRSFPLHGSCAASSGRPVAQPGTFGSRKPGVLPPWAAEPTFWPGHRGPCPLAVAQLPVVPLGFPCEEVPSWLFDPLCSTSGPSSTMKSVADEARCRVLVARCSLGLFLSRTCARLPFVVGTSRRVAEATRWPPPRRRPRCVRRVQLLAPSGCSSHQRAGG